MVKRSVVVLGVVAAAVLLNGCTRCGPIWDDWLEQPKSCRSDRP
ncbi:peptidylprolyl isomerase [Rhodopseudomonas palustris]|uniref:Peptidylprolyl isomerase n=1 Tax=Rhodopseudomonas palustris TaxID=1076 RepID=A0A418VKK0_RHOPL|nr:peptidylprolyl isomerase [Rhodopseudomonas palustris]